MMVTPVHPGIAELSLISLDSEVARVGVRSSWVRTVVFSALSEVRSADWGVVPEATTCETGEGRTRWRGFGKLRQKAKRRPLSKAELLEQRNVYISLR